MTKNVSSTEHVQQYRERQREAKRKLVRCYLEDETAAKLDQLESSQPHVRFAETLFTAAIEHAWTDHQVQQQKGSRILPDHPRSRCEPAHAGIPSLAHIPGRRRGFAASDADANIPSGQQGCA